MILGQIITDLREDRNYTQKELAKMLNISASSLSKYETGRSEPSISLLIQISDLFEVPVDYILGRCALKFDYSELNKNYVKGMSSFKLIDDILSLDATYRKHLVDEIELLKFKNDFDKLNKR